MRVRFMPPVLTSEALEELALIGHDAPQPLLETAIGALGFDSFVKSRGGWDRTSDLPVPNRARFHCATPRVGRSRSVCSIYPVYVHAENATSSFSRGQSRGHPRQISLQMTTPAADYESAESPVNTGYTGNPSFADNDTLVSVFYLQSVENAR